MKETENREDSSTLSIAYSEKWRLRPDIEWLAYPDSGRWVAIDPISNSFFYFDAIEYEIVSLMDGKRTGREILRKIRASTLRAIQDGHWFDVFVHKLLRCQLLELPVSSLRAAVLGTAGSERATRRFP